jgi:hypothetical protein
MATLNFNMDTMCLFRSSYHQQNTCKSKTKLKIPPPTKNQILAFKINQMDGWSIANIDTNTDQTRTISFLIYVSHFDTYEKAALQLKSFLTKHCASYCNVTWKEESPQHYFAELLIQYNIEQDIKHEFYHMIHRGLDAINV